MIFLTVISILLISNHNISECCVIKLLPYILIEKYTCISALEMASSGNDHCANCIGTLSLPAPRLPYESKVSFSSSRSGISRLQHHRSWRICIIIYYTMLTRLTRNALILSGGRGYRPGRRRRRYSTFAPSPNTCPP